ncbi:MAG: PspC domain-containing protein [Acidimicrobiia bacterium]|nr:PspC domain-containing protein [Acidimicrobiia bacterium]
MNDINIETSLQGNEVPPADTTNGSPGFETGAPEPHASAPTTSTSVNPRIKVLERKNGMIGGVAGGLADYLDIDATIVRLILVGLSLVTMPAIPLAYIVAWIIIPEEGKSAVTATPT